MFFEALLLISHPPLPQSDNGLAPVLWNTPPVHIPQQPLPDKVPCLGCGSFSPSSYNLRKCPPHLVGHFLSPPLLWSVSYQAQ